MKHLVSISDHHLCCMEPFHRIHRGNDAQQSILTDIQYLFRPDQTSRKQMVCSAPYACYFACLQIKSESIHSMWRKQKSLSKCSALELQNIFWGKSCNYSLKSISLLQLIIILRLFIQSYDASPATTKVYSGGSKAGCAQDRLRKYVLCSPPRTVTSDVDLWLGRYLTGEITHYESYDGNTLHCIAISQKQFITA